jgi:hypothetical protein
MQNFPRAPQLGFPNTCYEFHPNTCYVKSKRTPWR